MSDATPSRSLQKFLRHKPAIASLGIILIYVATAAVLLFTNLVTLQETLEPIATFSLPGFCAKKSPEKRLQDVERNISVINRALSRSNPAEQLKSVRNGSLVLKSQEPEVLQTALTAVDAIIERLYEFDDLDLLDEEASTETAAMLKDLNSAESMTNELFTLPAGQSESGYRFKLLLGTDQQGRSILVRAVWSVRVAILVALFDLCVHSQYRVADCPVICVQWWRVRQFSQQLDGRTRRKVTGRTSGRVADSGLHRLLCHVLDWALSSDPRGSLKAS